MYSEKNCSIYVVLINGYLQDDPGTHCVLIVEARDQAMSFLGVFMDDTFFAHVFKKVVGGIITFMLAGIDKGRIQRAVAPGYVSVVESRRGTHNNLI
ncbi:hypothetical protein [Francisella tularensis]|uniref:hypothetical protein n=1 Tax=Francisella tularensis TaxID=263 RepID=UPI0016804560|nr:hypothetical protein [Francisella tularensis]MBD2809291.1 hypothetical protein [Francisella tularensis]